ncbi:MAG: ECF transporter S component [Clostridium sp.]|uniref:ECF transporter S component n=1 Tax=Clostridium sp. TaxID=1506 RepID=UPI0025C730C4|nr:ECF transporter S component [Clostridium sp.]MCE5219970.1 ECF transporter S component [Clostridium sp.]
MEKGQIKTKDLTKMGLMAALVFFGTFFIKIPSISGYTHLGDCMIFVSVLILGWRKGAVASGIGAALADLLGGYTQWIIPTLFIKAIMAMIMGIMTEKLFPNLRFGWLIGATVGGLFQIAGYTFVRILLYGAAMGFVELPMLIIQTVSGVALSLVLVTTLLQSNIINKLKEI